MIKQAEIRVCMPGLQQGNDLITSVFTADTPKPFFLFFPFWGGGGGKIVHKHNPTSTSGVKLGSACRLPLADSEFLDPIQIVRIRFEKRAYTSSCES